MQNYSQPALLTTYASTVTHWKHASSYAGAATPVLLTALHYISNPGVRQQCCRLLDLIATLPNAITSSPETSQQFLAGQAHSECKGVHTPSVLLLGPSYSAERATTFQLNRRANSRLDFLKATLCVTPKKASPTAPASARSGAHTGTLAAPAQSSQAADHSATTAIDCRSSQHCFRTCKHHARGDKVISDPILDLIPSAAATRQ